MRKLYKASIIRVLWVFALLLAFSNVAQSQYCAPSYNNPCFNPGVTDDNINSFSTAGGITNISNLNTGCNGTQPANYIYNSGMTVTVMRGSSFTVQVQCSPGTGFAAFAQGFKIWVDWDQNGVFENNTSNSCETSFNSGSAGFQAFNGTINVPTTATLGMTRMRVRSAFSTVPATPCSNENYGETEDYNVMVVANPTNPGLTVLPVTICAGQTAALSATGGGLIKWYISQTAASFVGIGPNFTTPVLNTTTTYWVQTVINGCPSPRIPVTVTVNPPFSVAPTASVSTVCAGEDVTLTGPAGYASYTWTPAAVFASNTVNPATATIGAATTFTLTVTDAAGCSGSGTVDVGLEAAPPLTIVANTQSICPGESVTLTASGSGNGYNWLAADGLAASTTASVTATPSATTTYSVTANSTSGACPASASIAVTVNPLPIADAGLNTSVCIGSSVQLVATGGGTYSWSPSNGLSNTSIANPLASPNISGSYVVTVTSAAGCVATDDVLVTVNSLPTANPGSGAANCSGTGAQLSGSGGTTYLWTPNTGLNSPNISNPLATPAATADYTLTVTDANGCVSPPSAPITVTVFSQPAAPTITASGPLTFCQGGSVDLSVSGGVSYLWSNGATGATTTITASGTYTVTLTDANGCTSPASAAVVVNVTPGPTAPTITPNGPLVFCQGGSVQLSSSASASYEWSNGTLTQTANIAASGSYTVTIADALGCESTSAPITVTVNPLPASPVITAQSPAAFCPGGSTTLQAPSAASWLWNTGAVTQTIPVNTTGVFSVTVTDANGCTSPVSANFSTTLYPSPAAPVITANGNTTFCQGESVTLSVPAAQSYLWNTGQVSQSITVNSSGTFSVNTIDFNGCPAPLSAPVVVTMNPRPVAPTITAASTLSFCDGETVFLNANPTTGITWSTGATAANIEVGATGAYTATYTDANGCVSYASNSLVVNVIPLANTPVITANGPTDFCQGDSVILSCSNAPSYLWSNGSTSNSITAAASGIYSVTTSSQCPAADMTSDITVQARPIPVPSIDANLTKDCLPSTINFSASTSGIGPFLFDWSFGDGNSATSAQPSHEYIEAGDYSITLTLTDVIGCTGSQTIPNFIEILPRANLQFTIDPPVTTLSDPLVTFTGLTNNASAESWEIEGFGIFNEDQVEILFEDTGAYVVTYSAITAEGCEASKRDTVLIFDEFALYIPGAFSPNEDGLNDVFIPVASGFEAEDYEFQVFNRWGQRIFFTNQLGEGWTGNDVKQDVYIWTITGKSRINKETVEYKGSVTLIN